MMKLYPYLIFAGNAQEALDFYKDALEGEIVMLTRFGESPMPCDDDWKQKVMHARILFGSENLFMVSDAMKGNEVSTYGNIQLSIGFEDEEKTRNIFDRLATGGQVIMPLAKQFWGDFFGTCKDKFGIRWMFNCTSKK
jgi:PhnB protein